MKEYLVSVVAVCAVCALATTLTRQGKMGKQIDFVMSLAVLAVTVTPLFRQLPSIDNVGREFLYQLGDKYNVDTTENIILQDVTSEAVSDGIARAISDKFDLDIECISVESEVRVLGDDVIIERVRVRLSGRGAFSDASAIKRYIQKNLCDDCEVSFDAA